VAPPKTSLEKSFVAAEVIFDTEDDILYIAQPTVLKSKHLLCNKNSIHNLYKNSVIKQLSKKVCERKNVRFS